MSLNLLKTLQTWKINNTDTIYNIFYNTLKIFVCSVMMGGSRTEVDQLNLVIVSIDDDVLILDVAV